MKKYLYLSMAALMILAAVSCKKDGPKNEAPEEAVDMGIIMTRKDGTTYKLYWAKSNLCETGLCANPKDYGDYYAWGETEPKSEYYWPTYKFGTAQVGCPFSKYERRNEFETKDNKFVLEPEDDVACAKLGGKWRMPTFMEWDELLEKCTWTWTDNYNGTGVKGRIVTASNGNCIFLPAAGYSWPYQYSGGGQYWSSFLRVQDSYSAWSVSFDSDDAERNFSPRSAGLSVRPVWEE